MGGNSSKGSIANASQSRGSSSTVNTITTLNTIEDGSVLPAGKKQKKKGEKKSKSKDKSKVAGDEKGKKSKEKKKKHDGCKNHKRISFEDNAYLGVGGEDFQRCRKISACPSCDARDMLLDQVRSRSGSLRYSDFKKVVRQSRVYDKDGLPASVPLDGVPDPLPEAVCFICGVYTGSVTRTCRVCCHVYHKACLEKIEQGMDQRALQLAQLDMWSCHQCSDVSRLLTREETEHVFNCLNDLDIDPDNVTVKDYIAYKEKMCVALGRDVTQEKKMAWIGRFNFVAGDGDDNEDNVLDSSMFLQAETISILRNRCKDILVKLMTEMEFAEARKMFKDMMGQAGNTVTMAQVKDRIIQLYTKFCIRLWPEDEEDVASLDAEDFDKSVSWSKFLIILAIHMITMRENNPSVLSSIDNGNRDHDNSNNNGLMAPSFDSADDDYRTCESDLDSPTATATKTTTDTAAGGKITLSEIKTHKKNLSDVQILNESDDDANKSLSILDDLSKAFNLNSEVRSCDTQNNENGCQNDLISNTSHLGDNALMEGDSSPVSETESSTSAENSSSQKKHLWQKSPAILDNPIFTTSVDIVESGEKALREVKGHNSLENSSPMISKRRSEVLVRPSTEEGRSPRRALSQKLVAPAYGLVDKMQAQDWNC